MTDPTELPAPPPSGPLRLDGAFARRDLDDWLGAAAASLGGGASLDALARTTPDGLPIPLLGHESPVLGRLTRPPDPAADDALGAATRSWDNRLHVLGDTPSARAAHALVGLAGGASSLELAVGDLPGDARAGGVLPIEALPAALEGVHLEMIALALRAGDATEAAVDALLALYRERGHDPDAMHVELDADPLGELARRGRVAGGLDAARDRLGHVAARAAREIPLARVATIDTVVHHAAGASPVQELVAGIAAATFALDALLDAGLAPDTALATLGFRVALDADIVGGIVKLRALERLWRHTLESAGLPSAHARVVVETSSRQLSTLAPWVNHLRNIAACTAAAIGGADVVIVHPHDLVDGHRVGTDDPVADRVARNLPILLAEEGGLLAVEDAAGGAHAIESLTQSTAEAAWSALGELQGVGGLAAALASGDWQRDVARQHAERVARLARDERVLVGVSRFRHDDAELAAGTPPPPEERARTASGDDAGVPLTAVREARAFEGGDGPGRGGATHGAAGAGATR